MIRKPGEERDKSANTRAERKKGVKIPKFICKTLRLTLLLSLLIFAFLLYTVLKIRETPSVAVPMIPEMKTTALYRHVEALSVTIGSRSVYEYDRLNAAKDYIAASLRGMGYKPGIQSYLYEGRTYGNIVATLPGKDRPGGSRFGRCSLRHLRCHSRRGRQCQRRGHAPRIVPDPEAGNTWPDPEIRFLHPGRAARFPLGVHGKRGLRGKGAPRRRKNHGHDLPGNARILHR